MSKGKKLHNSTFLVRNSIFVFNFPESLPAFFWLARTPLSLLIWRRTKSFNPTYPFQPNPLNKLPPGPKMELRGFRRKEYCILSP